MQNYYTAIVIDAQNDFVDPQGALSVPGAVDDMHRGAVWLRQNAHLFSQIIASKDTHSAKRHIFLGDWWVNGQGEHPAPFTPITHQDYRNGTWRANYPEWQVWSGEYLQQLEEGGRQTHTIWPPHCVDGTWGHDLYPPILSALQYVTAVTDRQIQFIRKGDLAQVEHLSIFESEVKLPDEPKSQLDERLLYHLLTFRRIYFMGVAETHCVLESVWSVVRYFLRVRPSAISKIYLLTDCVSPIRLPEPMARLQQAYAEFRELGVNFTTSAEYLG